MNYKDFPSAYEPCFSNECPLKDSCLHKMYSTVMPDDITATWAILPTTLLKQNLKDGRCARYAEAKTVTCYADFSHLFDNVRRKDVKALRREVFDLLGSRFDFYRYSRAERHYLLTQPKADAVARLFRDYGYAAPEYGETFDTVIFD